MFDIMFMHQKRNETARLIVSHGQFIRSDHSSNCRAVRPYQVLSSEYIYSKLTYFPEAQQFTKKKNCIGLKYSNLLR